jgi:hypothetical protein
MRHSMEALHKAVDTLEWLAAQFRDRAADDGGQTAIDDADEVKAALEAVRVTEQWIRDGNR